MSSTGVRRTRTDSSRLGQAILDGDSSQIQQEKIFKDTGEENNVGAPGITNSEGAGNFLLKSGDIRNGQMGNNFGVVEIENDTIRADVTSPNFFPVLLLNGEGGADDTLSSITPGSNIFLNNELIVQAASQTITLKELAVTNPILTPGSADVVLVVGEYAKLIYSQLLSAWVVTWVSSGAGGGGDVSFPLDFPEEQRGTVGLTTEIIDFTQSDRHSVIMTLNGDIGLSLTNLPPGKLAITSIKLIQDGAGGHALTGFSQTVGNAQTIIDAVNDNNGPDDFVSFVVEFEDGILTAYLKTGNIVTGTGGGSDFSGNLSDLVINVNKDWAAQGISNVGTISGITNLDFDDALSTIFGLVDLQWFQAGHQFTSVSGEFNYRVDTLDKHIFHAGVNPILEIDDTTGLTIVGSHVINMGNNIINLISELQFSNANAHTPSNEYSIAFDINDNALKYSVALTTDLHQFYADTDLLASFSRVGSNEGLLSIQAVTATFLQATETVFLSTFNNTGPTNGEIWRDSGDGKFKFQENGVTKEIPDAIIAANTTLSNLTSPTSINQDLLFSATGFDMGDDTNPLDNLFVETIRLETGLLVTNRPSITSVTGNSIDIHVPTGATINLDYQTGGTTHIFSSSSYTTPNIIVNNTITFNDGLVLPNANGQFARNGNIMAVQSPEFAVLRNSIVATGEPSVLSIRKLADSITLGTTVATINFQSGISTAETWADISAGPLVGSGEDAAFLTFFIRAGDSLVNAFSIQGNDNDGDVMFLFGANDPVRLQPLLQPMGYFVTPQATDFLTNIGTSGSLEIPQINDGSPSVNDLTQAAGSFDGMIVHDINDGTIYIRNNVGQWDFYNRSGTVT